MPCEENLLPLPECLSGRNMGSKTPQSCFSIFATAEKVVYLCAEEVSATMLAPPY